MRGREEEKGTYGAEEPAADHAAAAVAAVEPVNHRVRVLGQGGGEDDDRVPGRHLENILVSVLPRP